MVEAGLLDRKEFDTIYGALAPVAYGVAFGIAQNQQLAETILTAVFKDLWNGGKPAQAGVKEILAATFASARTALARLLPVKEVQRRIGVEQARLLQTLRSGSRNQAGSITPSAK